MTNPRKDASLGDSLIQAMLSVAGYRLCIYVAGPLSTSREWYEIQASGVESDSEVLRVRHQARMAAFVEELRTSQSSPVVDPGLLRVSSWTGPDYGTFFKRVIDEMCFEVRLLEGWEYSAGASAEVVHALQRGLDCRLQDGTPLTAEAGKQLLEEARSVVKRLGLITERFDRRLTKLSQL